MDSETVETEQGNEPEIAATRMGVAFGRMAAQWEVVPMPAWVGTEWWGSSTVGQLMAALDMPADHVDASWLADVYSDAASEAYRAEMSA